MLILYQLHPDYEVQCDCGEVFYANLDEQASSGYNSYGAPFFSCPSCGSEQSCFDETIPEQKILEYKLKYGI